MAALPRGGTALPQAVPHPLDPLTADEIAAAARIVRDERGLGPPARFVLEGGWRGASVPRRANLHTVAVYHKGKKAVTVLVLEGRNPSRGRLVQGLQAAHGEVEQVHLAMWG
jgi:hypothetical protein